MKLVVKVNEDKRHNYFFLEVFKPEDVLTCIYRSSRVYETEEEANLAAAIMQLYFLELNYKSDFDPSEFDFRVRSVFRLLDCPNKW